MCRGSPSVIVVEGHAVLAERVGRLAASCGADVRIAVDVGAALALLRDGQCRALLVAVDQLSWPDLPELAALRGAAPGALLIALTAAWDPELERACLRRGADRVLSAHADTAALAGLVRGALAAPLTRR